MSIYNNLIELIKINLKDIIKLRAQKYLKEDSSYVSEGDLLCERIIIEYFHKLYPDAIIVSEESCKTNYIPTDTEKYIITIDPIDGTENFISGLKEWGIGISVYQGNQHIESLIALPELDEYMVTGQSLLKFESRIYGVSSSLSKEDILNLETGFEYRIIGCSMYNMFNVIRGSYQVFQNPKGAFHGIFYPD